MTSERQYQNDDEPTEEKLRNEMTEVVRQYGFDYVDVERADGGQDQGDYVVITFASELDAPDNIQKERRDIAEGEPTAAISYQFGRDEFDVVTGHGTKRGWNVSDLYDTVDTLSEAVQAAEHWFENKTDQPEVIQNLDTQLFGEIIDWHEEDGQVVSIVFHPDDEEQPAVHEILDYDAESGQIEIGEIVEVEVPYQGWEAEDYI